MAAPTRSKANKPDTTQAFKSAMGAAVRAIAGKPELEVSFSADRPLLTSDKARLANLPRLPTRRDIAIAQYEKSIQTAFVKWPSGKFAGNLSNLPLRFTYKDTPVVVITAKSARPSLLKSPGAMQMTGRAGTVGR